MIAYGLLQKTQTKEEEEIMQKAKKLEKKRPQKALSKIFKDKKLSKVRKSSKPASEPLRIIRKDIEKPRNLLNDQFTYGNQLSPVKKLKFKYF